MDAVPEVGVVLHHRLKALSGLLGDSGLMLNASVFVSAQCSLSITLPSRRQRIPEPCPMPCVKPSRLGCLRPPDAWWSQPFGKAVRR